MDAWTRELRNQANLRAAESRYLDPPDSERVGTCPVCKGDSFNFKPCDDIDHSGRCKGHVTDCEVCEEARAFCRDNDSAIHIEDHNFVVGRLQYALNMVMVKNYGANWRKLEAASGEAGREIRQAQTAWGVKP